VECSKEDEMQEKIQHSNLRNGFESTKNLIFDKDENTISSIGNDFFKILKI
jgi:hypothetical protein